MFLCDDILYSVECCSDPSVLDFKKEYRFKGGKITAPT